MDAITDTKVEPGSRFEVSMLVAPEYPFDDAAHVILEGLRISAQRFVEQHTPPCKNWTWEELPAKEDPMYGPSVGYHTRRIDPEEYNQANAGVHLKHPIVQCILAGKIVEG